MIQQMPLRCVFSAITFAVTPPLTELTGYLSRSGSVETLETPKCCTSVGYYYRSPPARFELDVRWGFAGVYQETP